MRGLMQETPLMISSILSHAARFHGDTEIVSRSVEGPIHRYGYEELERRSKKLARALGGLGVKLGDVIGTLAWNTNRHLELYFGVSGLGAICHTINPRLFQDQIVYIANHAEDAYLFLDLSFVDLVEALADKFESIKGFVILSDEDHMPKTSLKNVHCYETLLAARDDDFDWPVFDENTASSLCYTSGTTGNPKGVLYSHRSTVLHAMASCAVDTIGISARDSVMPVVPMFHANAWGLPYASTMAGCKTVLPGPNMDGRSIHELMVAEGVTIGAGVPTVWLLLLDYWDKLSAVPPSLNKVICGGSAAPKSMIDKFQSQYGVQFIHAWGMTETSPLGTIGCFKAGMDELSAEEKLNIQAKQGRGICGAELKVTDDNNIELPWDGESFGPLKIRGPWVAKGYFKGVGDDSFDEDGWFDTGDVSTMDAEGYMQITDRAKDVIKSGGEWIGSIELENIAVGHPEVAEAAVIGVRHPKWDERPLLIAVRAGGSTLTAEELLAFYDGKIAKWWTPDDVIFVDELPHTATGKLKKTQLREEFKEYVLPTAAE